MSCNATFVSPALVGGRPQLLLSKPLTNQSTLNYACPKSKATWSASADAVPDAGLIPKAGVTGTICTNLFPIPILGGYGWFLTVYKRDIAASVGPFVARFPDNNTIQFRFRPGQKASSSDDSEIHRAFRGVAAGNINVRTALKKLAREDADYELRFFEKGGSQLLTNRRNELHINSSDGSGEDMVENILWRDTAPTYRVVSRSSSYEVREVYASGGFQARKPARFEYFCMNLFPIFPLWKYSAFVCVWRQHRNTSSVSIDKHGKGMELKVLDALELPESAETPTPIGKFAVRSFNGVVSDTTVTTEHRDTLNAIAASPTIKATSHEDFRVVVDNTPNTLTSRRNNELWVPVS